MTGLGLFPMDAYYTVFCGCRSFCSRAEAPLTTDTPNRNMTNPALLNRKHR